MSDVANKSGWQKFIDFANSPAGASGVGSLLQGASGVIGSIIAGRNARKLAAEQNAYNEAMWNKQNAYNTPQAQKQRLIDAGLNPALMYGGGGAQNVAESPQPASDAAVQSPNHIMDGVLAAGQAIGGAVKSALQAVSQHLDNKNKSQDYEHNAIMQPLLQSYQRWRNQSAMFQSMSDEQKAIIDTLDADLKAALYTDELEGLRNYYNSFSAAYAKLWQEADRLNLENEGVRKDWPHLRKMASAQLALLQIQYDAVEQGIKLSEAETAQIWEGLKVLYGDGGYYTNLAAMSAKEREWYDKTQSLLNGFTEANTNYVEGKTKAIPWEIGASYMSSIAQIISAGANYYGPGASQVNSMEAIMSRIYQAQGRTPVGLYVPNNKNSVPPLVYP